jgi:stearoyl-CoA desaturase (delta-9 desaturase)
MQEIAESGAGVAASESLYARIPGLPTLVYWGIHALCIAVLWTPPTVGLLALLGATFWVRMFFVTGGYHRYFSHKTYKTSRTFQFVIALFGSMAVQKGPLWWAGIHRLHHRYSDEPSRDPHTPFDGFWYSHAGWIQDPRWDPTPIEQVRDLARFPELRWLNRWHFVAPVGLALALVALGGWPAFLWGFAVSTVLLWHSTYTINSLAHRFGTRRFETPDSSRNNWMLALLTMGEGWHNNHHRYMASTRQGFLWWEVDATYYVLRGLAALGLVWELREPPAELLEEPSLREAA